MKLSEHFNLKEFINSPTANKLNIDNTPPNDVKENLKNLADRLEVIRERLHNKPIIITSGYRCPSLNSAVRGKPNSAHISGYAADFICPEYGTPQQVFDSLVDTERFDQLIIEQSGSKRWIHISFDPRMRGISFHYVNDKTW